MKVWLSPEILDWDRNPGGYFFSYEKDTKPYSILKQARKRLGEVEGSGNDGRFALGDAYKNLKEATEYREKQIRKRYSFNELPFGKIKRTDRQLLRLGIIQPVLLKKLTDIRNEVTHEQNYPQNNQKEIEKALELWEFVWYFIRATDVFLSRFTTGIIFYPQEIECFHDPGYSSDQPGCLYVGMFDEDDDPWDIGSEDDDSRNIIGGFGIRGHGLSKNLFSFEKKEGWIEIKDIEEINGFEYPEIEDKQTVITSSNSKELFSIDGSIDLKDSNILDIYKRYFELFLFH